MQGEESFISKAQNLSGRHGRICDGHKREGKCAIPGEVCPVSKQFQPEEGGTDRVPLEDGMTAVQKSAEAIVITTIVAMRG